MPSLPVLSKCTHCDTIFWLADIEQIGSYSFGDKNNEEWEAAESAIFLDIDDLFRALTLDDVVAEKDDELFIRKSIWWAYNDRVRNGEKLHESLEDEIKWRENINQLMNLFDSDVDYDKIFIAELYRNIGNFEECIRIIDSISSADLGWVNEAIKKECQNRNTQVFQLR